MSGIVSDNIDRQSDVIAEAAGGAEIRSDDPSASEGTVWFNTTSGTLKVYRNISAWSSGGALGTAVANHTGFGLQGAAVSVGGHDGSRTAECEEYNGSTWTTSGVNDLGTATQDMPSCGTQTAGLVTGGWTGSTVATGTEYDGSSWATAGAGDLSTARYGHGMGGIQTAAFAVAGYDGSNRIQTTEEYDGSSWSSGNNNAATKDGIQQGCGGTLTAGLLVGGTTNGSSALAVTEEYDGTNWSAGGNLNTGRWVHTAEGLQTDAFTAGGTSDNGSTIIATVETYNGSAWSSGTSLATATRDPAGAGNAASAGLLFGGKNPSSRTTNTFELSATTTARTVTDS